MKIILNGQETMIADGHGPFFYRFVANCAGFKADQEPTITWTDGGRSGAIAPGQAVMLGEGAIVNAAITGDA